MRRTEPTDVCTFIGNIGKDPEWKDVGTGLCTFGLAVSKDYKSKNGEWVKKSVWRNIAVWGDDAKHVAEEFRKGDRVKVVCESEDREYRDKDGVDRKTTQYKVGRPGNYVIHCPWPPKRSAAPAAVVPDEPGDLPF